MADASSSSVAPAAGGPAKPNKKYYFVHVEQEEGGDTVATGIIKASSGLTDEGVIGGLKDLMIDCAAKVDKEGEGKDAEYDISVPTDGSNYKDADEFNACKPTILAGGAKRTRLRKTKSNKNKRNRRKSRRQ